MPEHTETRDDARFQVNVIAPTLRRQGYLVLLRRTRWRRVGTIQVPFTFLLSDVVLPGLSGRELGRPGLLAEDPDVRVLYMSGYTGDAVVHHDALQPGLAFIQKPFTGDALLLKIRDVLDRPRPSV